MLTQARLKELLSYGADTGEFTRIKTVGRCNAGTVSGFSDCSEGYTCIHIDGRTFKAHRVAWLYTHGYWPDHIDHINGIRTDNRILNLRDITKAENAKNQRVPKNNTSGLIGVYWDKGKRKWMVGIGVNKKLKHIGYYDYKWDAICARKSSENKYGFHVNHGRP